ncbi:Carboxylesterase, type B [Cordyceps fumosorosea ARSEF 2679]|uniref:Carboxylic ester hydrolase n=1 Tax=Cordyceps fumosorosea (strain ARSEF 2679) TaxID=1081104 RepID=A0A167TM61_CORFA|nr:Carboxylesterase, type B [Cordyceps fumosorosea ARSEF 2679]OAA60741.1 Carboxylesterase, type B [Cordyceps fumosorosea ARSEF 2679]
MKLSIAALAVFPFSAVAAPRSTPPLTHVPRAAEVTVEIPGGTIIGNVTGVESFHGIPFADPPVGQLRLRPPQRRTRPLGRFDATSAAPACPQMPLNTSEVLLPPLFGKDMTPEKWPDGEIRGQEDCLTVNVQRPRGTRPDAKLPVLFYIFGGGFIAGSTNLNDAEKFLEFASAQSQPFIFVGVNYRLGAFGFLGGAEVVADGTANLGLRDQRMGLEWVADNIAYFGGDPERVTLWGQSSGSISVFDQLALYNGNATYNGRALFRGAIMNSGSVLVTERADSPRARAMFDKVVEEANCSHAAPEAKLDCLREAPFPLFYKAANSVPRILDNSSLALPFPPRQDGEVLVDSPEIIAEMGNYFAVPSILTDQADEGTVFSFAQHHVNSTEKLVEYLKETFFDKTTVETVEELVTTYPEDSAAGSPFQTGQNNEWYEDTYGTGRGFKRLAAILGDFVFTLIRRMALHSMAASHPEVKRWSSLSSFATGIAAYYGTPHGADLNMMFSGVGIPAQSTRTYYLNFLYHLNPNGRDGDEGKWREWPEWTPESPLMLHTKLLVNDLLNDTFRSESYQVLKDKTRDFAF